MNNSSKETIQDRTKETVKVLNGILLESNFETPIIRLHCLLKCDYLFALPSNLLFTEFYVSFSDFLAKVKKNVLFFYRAVFMKKSALSAVTCENNDCLYPRNSERGHERWSSDTR